MFGREIKRKMAKSSSQRSYEHRIRKKIYLKSIEEKVEKLEAENIELKNQIVNLKQELKNKNSVISPFLTSKFRVVKNNFLKDSAQLYMNMKTTIIITF